MNSSSFKKDWKSLRWVRFTLRILRTPTLSMSPKSLKKKKTSFFKKSIHSTSVQKETWFTEMKKTCLFQTKLSSVVTKTCDHLWKRRWCRESLISRDPSVSTTRKQTRTTLSCSRKAKRAIENKVSLAKNQTICTLISMWSAMIPSSAETNRFKAWTR